MSFLYLHVRFPGKLFANREIKDASYFFLLKKKKVTKKENKLKKSKIIKILKNTFSEVMNGNE